jgi:hypothetical protein
MDLQIQRGLFLPLHSLALELDLFSILSTQRYLPNVYKDMKEFSQLLFYDIKSTNYKIESIYENKMWDYL